MSHTFSHWWTGWDMLGGGGSWFDKLPPEADVSHHERAIETRQKAVAIKSFWVPAQGRDDES